MSEPLTSEAEGLFAVLRQSVDVETVAAIERFVAEASDRELCRINLIDFAARQRLDDERVIAAFLHAARLGIFELSWNVLCPGCGGVLDASATLKSVNREEYICALCAEGYEPNLDEMVEVTFTVSRRVRRIAAHEPDQLPFFEYMRQIFWSSGIDLPDDLEQLGEEITLDTLELPAREKAQLSLQLPPQFLSVFDPVSKRLWSDVDALLLPANLWTTPGRLPFARTNDPEDLKNVGFPGGKAGGPHIAIFNLTGHPAVVVPLSKTDQGFPIAVQIAGRLYDEQRLLRIANVIERNSSWTTNPSDLEPKLAAAG